ncbi:DUF4338 domain-containing protein [Desulfopila sp. IMCC35006]|uniref:Druantia anti-phage system protein DruA n=1 Tax=Desulfopila sp. IMCC35006 TaxID=2569542 RepID=UPI0010AC38C3|nr:Druantia anti-phage system protein DruA [Desulfopila sp. IMCC35006]TKB23954.1 DUF4338 domain-containing protein [Desulfopila sp. IMCC35006]
MNVPLTYRKRVITQDDLSFIRKVIDDYQSEGRSVISRRLCEAWDWRQANGHLKDGVCRGLLLQLERNQLVTLPPRIIDNNNNAKRRRKTQATFDFFPTPLNAVLANLAPIELRQVRRTPEEKLFNALVREHHYLGYTHLVGEHLKYLVYAGDRLLACFAFSSAPYAIDCRDIFLGWSQEARERNRHLLAYNSRFLILPWVRVPHLASHLLRRIAKTISGDWQTLYHHPILWLETFVDTEKFAGTCYRAANWTFLGLTSGRGTKSKSQKQLTSIKAMYGYPLVRNYLDKLRNE